MKNLVRDSFVLLVIGPSVSIGSAGPQKLRLLTKNCSDSERTVSPEVQPIEGRGYSDFCVFRISWTSVHLSG